MEGILRRTVDVVTKFLFVFGVLVALPGLLILWGVANLRDSFGLSL